MNRLRNMPIAPKLIIAVAFTLAVVIGMLGFTNNKMENGHDMEASRDSAHRTNLLILDALARDMEYGAVDGIRDTIGMLKKRQPDINRIRVIGEEGRVIASSDRKEIGMKLNKSEKICASCHEAKENIPGISQFGTNFITVSTSIKNEKKCSEAECHMHDASKDILGMIHTDFSLKSLNASIEQRRLETLIAVLVAIFIVTIIIALFLRFFVSQPVNSLLSAMNKVADGDLDYHHRIVRRDEIGQLATGFNNMIARLKGMVGQLQNIMDGNRERSAYLESEVARLRQTMEAAASGDLSVRYDVRAQDEFALIGESLNKMTSELNSRIIEDERRHRDLETQVRKMLGVMEASANGDLSQRYDEKRDDEIGRLGMTLNRMLDDLNCLINDGKARHEHLEAEVARLLRHIKLLASGDFEVEFKAAGNDSFGQIGDALNKMSDSIVEMIKKIEDMTAQDHRKRQVLQTQVEGILRIVTRASQGDLTKSLSRGGGDEVIEELKQRLNRMFNSLRDMIGKIGESSGKIEQNGEAIHDVTGRLEAGVVKQLDFIERTAAAVDDMAKSITDMGYRSNAMMRISREAAHQANSGGETVSRALESMTTISDSMHEIHSVIEELETSTDDIKGIVKVIQEFSDQTQLLALNASIEAARAGDFGRGFSVVAKEISSLAQNTVNSAREITSVVNKVQSRVSRATSAANDTAGIVRDSVSLAKESGQALDEIIDAVEQVSTLIRDTVSALDEQKTKSETIRGNMDQVSMISSESADRVRDAALTAQALNELANELDGMVQQFKIGERTKLTTVA